MKRRDYHDERPTVKVFYVDGAGARPDGTGSAFAWIREGTDIVRVKQINGLTSNQAEYRGLIAVLRYVSHRSQVMIFTDSQLVAEQFAGRYAVRDKELARLLSEAQEIIWEKALDVRVKWIPREENLVGKYLEELKKHHQYPGKETA
jgi:ribonuclease HI